MLLKEWMDKKGMTCAQFADQMLVSRQVVMLWYAGIRSPQLLNAIEINKITKGRVKIIDLLSTYDRSKYEKKFN